MRVLVGCEESGYLRSEFRRHGHGAWSCDLLPAADGSGYHLQCDIHYALAKSWDLIILHPPCTALCVAGNKHYAGSRERDAALTWTRQLWELARKAAPRVCLEQPVSVLNLPDAEKQYLQPWNFHVAETKLTVLHTCGLPQLKVWTEQAPAVLHNIVWKMPPSADRSRKRGHLAWLARPMAEQWGSL